MKNKLFYGFAVVLIMGIAAKLFAELILPVKSAPETLPSDELVISHFNKNKLDMVEVTLKYRSYKAPKVDDHQLWADQADVSLLLRRASIESIDNVSPIWPLHPYSREDSWRELRSIPIEENNKFGTVRIRLSIPDIYQNRVWKDIIYFPTKPLIRDGVLYGPFNAAGISPFTIRIVPSLDKALPAVRVGECVMREIETLWFIRFCKVLS